MCSVTVVIQCTQVSLKTCLCNEHLCRCQPPQRGQTFQRHLSWPQTQTSDGQKIIRCVLVYSQGNMNIRGEVFEELQQNVAVWFWQHNHENCEAVKQVCTPGWVWLDVTSQLTPHWSTWQLQAKLWAELWTLTLQMEANKGTVKGD